MHALDPSGPLSTQKKKQQLTVLDLVHVGDKDSCDNVRGFEGGANTAKEAGTTTKPGLSIDDWEQQDCEALTSSVLAGTSASRETTGSWRRQSSFLRLRQVSKSDHI
jgi:hypothetical protein